MSYDTIQLRVDEPTAWMLRRHARKRGCSEEEVLYSALNEAFEIPVSRRSIPPRRAAWHDMTRPMAFAADPLTRETRAARAKVLIHDHFPDKQEAFLTFVLAQYVKEGVGELEPEKLSPLLKLKYTALADAVKDLGDVDQIRDAFVGFQKYLYGTAG